MHKDNLSVIQAFGNNFPSKHNSTYNPKIIDNTIVVKRRGNINDTNKVHSAQNPPSLKKSIIKDELTKSKIENCGKVEVQHEIPAYIQESFYKVTTNNPQETGFRINSKHPTEKLEKIMFDPNKFDDKNTPLKANLNVRSRWLNDGRNTLKNNKNIISINSTDLKASKSLNLFSNSHNTFIIFHNKNGKMQDCISRNTTQKQKNEIISEVRINSAIKKGANMIIKGKLPSNETSVTYPQKNIKPLSPKTELMTINKNLRNIMPLQSETEPIFNKKSQTSSKYDCVIHENIFIDNKNFTRKNTEDIPSIPNKADMKKQLKCMDMRLLFILRISKQIKGEGGGRASS